MKKFLFLLISFTIALAGFPQNNPALNLPKDAKVEGCVVDMRSKEPKNNELVIFRSHKNNNEYQAISDESGKFFTRLPAGDQYDIFIMGFKDTISQNVMTIPALGPNSYYKNPFVVTLEFDPPKTFVLENVEFDFGKATLRPQSYQTLDEKTCLVQNLPSVYKLRFAYLNCIKIPLH